MVTDIYGWGAKLANWIKVMRLQTGLVTALALWVGYISVEPLTVKYAVLLGAVGLFVHVWGFLYNEICDAEYDRRHGDTSGHLIAKGQIDSSYAIVVSWTSLLTAIAISFLLSVLATATLIASVIPGYLYDKYSKKHWWSNIYLSVWAALMVLTGGLYAGSINLFTGLIAVAIAIQILVQVVQGDLKDIKGPENTLAERLGVKVKEGVVTYTKKFTWLVYGLKFLEASILIFIAVLITQNNTVFPVTFYNILAGYYILLIAIGVIFVTTAIMFLVHYYDRDEIKQKSSVHELVSIMFLGTALAPFDIYSALLVGLAPILWYVAVNHLIHSSALNPDI